jgi:uncharacterized coiled-coil DUF342 family protein
MTAEEQLDKTIEESLNQKMEEVAKEIGKPLTVRRQENATQQVLDMGRILAAGAKLLKTKTQELSDEISSYGLQRIEIIDSYRVRMESLKAEAEEQVRMLDQEHQDKISSLEKIISKLRVLRGE